MKGTWKGPCNRAACQIMGATWFNQSTRAYYCAECAALINRANARDAFELYGDPRLCIEVSESRGEGPGVIRYVVTHIDKDGLRALAVPAQGRCTHETIHGARKWIADVFASNGRESLRSLYGMPLEARPVECWPVHFDPKGVYFDDTLKIIDSLKTPLDRVREL